MTTTTETFGTRGAVSPNPNQGDGRIHIRRPTFQVPVRSPISESRQIAEFRTPLQVGRDIKKGIETRTASRLRTLADRLDPNLISTTVDALADGSDLPDVSIPVDPTTIVAPLPTTPQPDVADVSAEPVVEPAAGGDDQALSAVTDRLAAVVNPTEPDQPTEVLSAEAHDATSTALPDDEGADDDTARIRSQIADAIQQPTPTTAVSDATTTPQPDVADVSAEPVVEPAAGGDDQALSAVTDRLAAVVNPTEPDQPTEVLSAEAHDATSTALPDDEGADKSFETRATHASTSRDFLEAIKDLTPEQRYRCVMQRLEGLSNELSNELGQPIINRDAIQRISSDMSQLEDVQKSIREEIEKCDETSVGMTRKDKLSLLLLLITLGVGASMLKGIMQEV